MPYPEILTQNNPNRPTITPFTNYEDRKKPCKKHTDKKTLIENTINGERGAEENIPEEQIKFKEFKATARKLKEMYNNENDKVEVFVIQKKNLINEKLIGLKSMKQKSTNMFSID